MIAMKKVECIIIWTYEGQEDLPESNGALSVDLGKGSKGLGVGKDLIG